MTSTALSAPFALADHAHPSSAIGRDWLPEFPLLRRLVLGSAPAVMSLPKALQRVLVCSSLALLLFIEGVLGADIPEIVRQAKPAIVQIFSI
jgi:hypothetical protein